MSEAIKITATVGAYLAGHRGSPADIVEAVSTKDNKVHTALVGTILTYSAYDMSNTWTRVGDAQITVTFLPYDEQVASAIKALQGELDEARRKFMELQSSVMERISKLQALEYSGSEA